MLQRALILSDIDGTLIDTHHQLQPEVIQAVQDYHHAGGHFVLASARPVLGMTPLARQLAVALPIAALNGALIVETDPDDPNHMTTLLEQPLPDGDAAALITRIRDAGLPISINLHAGTRWVVEAHDAWSKQEGDILGFQPETEPLMPLATSGTAIHKVLCMGEPDAIDQLAALVAASDLALDASRSKPTYLELTARGVAKSTALRHLADYWNLPIDQTMAIGDGENDLPMMQAAGLGVAMGNALPTVAATIATKVADNDHAGVAEAIHRYAMPLSTGA